jgi:hypothetical protein
MLANTILDFLADIPAWLWAILGLVIGIASCYLTVRVASRTRLFYALHTSNLIRDADDLAMPDVSISFRRYDKPVINLSVTRFVLWNGGNHGVKRADVRKSIALAISDGHSILSRNIIARHRADGLNEFVCTMSDDRLRLSVEFDFIDRHQGIVVQIFHTGLSNEAFGIDGYVQDMGPPRYRYVIGAGNNPLPSRKPKRAISNWIRLMLGSLVALVPLVLIYALLFLPPGQVYSQNDPGHTVAALNGHTVAALNVASALLAITVVVLLSCICWSIAYVIVFRAVPKELRVFEQG